MTLPDRRSALRGLLALAATTLPMVIPAAHAQMTVFDPANYAQNILTAAHTLQQINNQIISLQHEAQSLINQARNLTTLPLSVLTQLQQSVNQTKALIAQAQNIAYDVRQIDQAFQSLYGPASISSTDSALIAGAQTRWKNTVGGLQDAMRTQATVLGNSANYQTQLGALVTASQSADGALAATQAGNQLLALQAQQISDLTALLASQARAQDLKSAEDAAATAQAAELRRRFLTRPNGYQSGNAQMFYGH
ncbi:P-type conjugative transfer protein TrbJ [Asticcacaulis sp.]|uniref:P-type conjugative transfer protein TrbJ n=1 Tax=Asticcacaulis sp. TaxID=1872648 RepID=UPI002BE522B2|nr:P-type conjugative transfer protein TrbJ [Asticcacaulis sp.]HTM82247.1 P-type conjugative transfer protein TrbJ [Asticcacaulis sp.]